MAGDFVDLHCYQQGESLAEMTSRLVRLLRGPGSNAVADQMIRAAFSVTGNVAEGHGRGLTRDGCRFL